MNPSNRPRTGVSSDKLMAAQAPPTRIKDDKMELDPKKVIEAWAASADVMRDVADAIRENVQDNDNIRQDLREHRKRMLGVVALVLTLQLVTLLLFVLSR